MQDYQDRLRITTPEGVDLELVLAGVGSRFVAAFADILFRLVLGGAALAAAAALGEDLGVVLLSVAAFVLLFAYDVVFETFRGGRTPGKALAGLRVLRADGRPVDFVASAVRNVLRLVDGYLLAFLPGVVSILATERNQRPGDIAAGTIVVREPRTVAPSPGEGSARPAPAGAPLDAAGVTAAEVATVRSFLQRRTSLPARARADIAARLAGALAPKVGGAENLAAEELLERVVAAKDRRG